MNDKNKRHLPLAKPTDKDGEARSYAEIMDGPEPKCGGCMWLHMRRPSSNDHCAELRIPDGAGGTYRITEESEVCKYFTPKSPEVEKFYRAFMAAPLGALESTASILRVILKEKRTEAPKENVIGVKDFVEYTLTENDDEVNTYRGTVTDRGRAHIMVARRAPTAEDPNHMELDKLPLSLATLKVIKSHALTSVDDGVNKHNKSSGDPEQIKRVKAKRAKRMKSILTAISKTSKKKRAPLSAVMEFVSNVEESVVKTLITDLRSFKMVARKEGRYKLTEYGEHCVGRLHKSSDVVVTWYKLERIAREKNGLLPKPEVPVEAPIVKRPLTLVPPWEDTKLPPSAKRGDVVAPVATKPKKKKKLVSTKH